MTMKLVCSRQPPNSISREMMSTWEPPYRVCFIYSKLDTGQKTALTSTADSILYKTGHTKVDCQALLRQGKQCFIIPVWEKSLLDILGHKAEGRCSYDGGDLERVPRLSAPLSVLEFCKLLAWTSAILSSLFLLRSLMRMKPR